MAKSRLKYLGNGRSPGLRVLLSVAVGIGIAGTERLAAGMPIREVKWGLLNHDTDGLWSGFRRERGADLNVEVIFAASRELWRGHVRPAAGVTVNMSGDTSRLYACWRWEYELRGGLVVAFGFGAALHDGETARVVANRKALGSRVLFHTAAEVGYAIARRHVLSVYFDHMSNAGLADENEGMDTLGVRYGFRF